VIIGQINVLFGWAWMCLGFVFGMTLGMWAEGEKWLGGYASIARRYLRLGHVAFIALSIIHIKNIGSYLMIFGAAGVPLTCISAAFFRKTKYFLPLPALAILTGISILVIGMIL